MYVIMPAKFQNVWDIWEENRDTFISENCVILNSSPKFTRKYERCSIMSNDKKGWLMEDVRKVIFAGIQDKRFLAEITVQRDGVLSGNQAALEKAFQLGISLNLHKGEGDFVEKGEVIAEVEACPMGIAQAEEVIMGAMAKASGIATAAHKAVALAGENMEIVAGAWKKMPPEMKHIVRQAVTAGGASFRISHKPMVYLDKNFISMVGGIQKTLETVSHLTEFDKVVQIRENAPIACQTKEALAHGCTIFMVDTGEISDYRICLETLKEAGVRDKVKVAFSGEILMADIPGLKGEDIDLLCIGKEIIDAPMLDMRFDMIKE